MLYASLMISTKIAALSESWSAPRICGTVSGAPKHVSLILIGGSLQLVDRLKVIITLQFD